MAKEKTRVIARFKVSVFEDGDLKIYPLDNGINFNLSPVYFEDFHKMLRCILKKHYKKVVKIQIKNMGE